MIDSELLVRDWLASTFSDAHVVTEMPKDITLLNYLPLLHVGRFGGTNSRPGLDRAVIDVDSFADATVGQVLDGRNDARKLAERVRDAILRTLPGYVINGATVTGVATVSAPTFRPYDNTSVRRYGATYAVFVKPSP